MELRAKFQRQNEAIFNTFSSKKYSSEENINYVLNLFEKHLFNPPTKKQALEDFLLLSDTMFMYVVVEINMMEKEGCIPYELREPGCLKAFFAGLRQAFLQANEKKISVQDFFSIHKIITDPKHVKITAIDADTSGKFRLPTFDEIITLDPKWLSVEGLDFLLKLIASEEFHSMKLEKESDLDKLDALFAAKNEAKLLVAFCYAVEWIAEGAITTSEMLKAEIEKNFNLTLAQLRELIALKNVEQIGRHFSHENLNLLANVFAMLEESESENAMFLCLKNSTKNLDFLNQVASVKQTYIELFEEYTESLEHEVSFAPELERLTLLKIQENPEAFIKSLSENDDNLVITAVDYNDMIKLVYEIIKQLKKLPPPKQDDPVTWLNDFLALLQKLLLTHPFTDANNRALLNAFTNAQLMEIYSLCAVYFNPFGFYANSPAQVLAAEKIACGNFLAMIDASKNNNPRGFIFNEILVTEKEQLKFHPAKIANLKKERQQLITDIVQPFKEFLRIQVMIESIKEKFMIEFKPVQQNLFKTENPLMDILQNEMLSLSHCANTVSAVTILSGYATKHSKANPELALFYERFIANVELEHKQQSASTEIKFPHQTVS